MHKYTTTKSTDLDLTNMNSSIQRDFGKFQALHLMLVLNLPMNMQSLIWLVLLA